MRKKDNVGICKICGESKKLSFEHVPPQNAFNSNKVKRVPFREIVKTFTGLNNRMPWDMSDIKGKLEQRGNGDYYLCESCNNNTGSWYMNDYCSFVNTLNTIIQNGNFQVGNRYFIEINDLYPLRLYKAIMTMFCDINNFTENNQMLREFLLNKEENMLDEKYSLYIYLVSPGLKRFNDLFAKFDVYTNDIILSSEIATYPLGFALYIDKPKNFIPEGINIDCFKCFGYDDKQKIVFNGIPYIEINSLLPIDYRTKEEIIKKL